MLRRVTTLQATFDVALAGVFALVLGLPSLGLSTGTAELRYILVLLVVMTALVALRRIAPMLTLLVGLGLGVGFVALNLSVLTPLWFGVLVLLYTVGRYCGGLQRVLGAVVALLGAALIGVWFVRSSFLGDLVGASFYDVLLRFGFATLGFALAFGLALVTGILVGEILRSRSLAHETRAERERAEVEQERTGIARDMHDVVAHSLAVVIAQANGARYHPSVEQKDESLAQIAQTASAALGDVRGLLERLRHAQAPDPDTSLDNLPDLLLRVRAAGLRVELREQGPPVRLARAADVAGYRIVQEALTNALRHGDRAHPVLVSITRGPWLEIVVRNAMRQAPGESGHGLVGMRERARIAGGHMELGPADGAWVVRAMLPIWEGTA